MKPRNRQFLRLAGLELFVWGSLILLLAAYNLILVPYGMHLTGTEKILADIIRFSIAGIGLVAWLGAWYALTRLILTKGLEDRIQPMKE